MKHTVLLSFILSVFTLPGLSQPDETLITIGSTKISKGEFERIYQKNNNNLYNPDDKKTPEDYLQLFVDFKLKVIEAETLKMDTSAAFVNELAGYRTELAAPYLTDVTYTEQMVKELYDRTTKEISASHLLLNVSPNATRQEEEEVREKILKIKQEIIAGKDFGDAAVEYSQDPSAKNNKGELGYFSAFNMVVPFENAAFSTPSGEISEPVRTQYGWHILKVHDIRKNQGEILVAHIMKMFPRDMTPETKANLKLQIDSIYTAVKNGADFGQLAREKSDDKRSAQQNGEMPWFASGRMIQEFSKPAFALQNKGDISEVIETPYGYHIIKKLDTRPVPSFEESKKELEARIKQDPQRSQTSKTVFISKLKKEYNFTENLANIDNLMKKNIGDSTLNMQDVLFVLNGNEYKTAQFISWLKNENISKGAFNKNYTPWVEAEITAYEDSKLEEKYPDFRYLMQEYHDGMLLFNISEIKIWNFAAEDTAGLEQFYKGCKKYMWEERFKGMIITCKNDSVRQEADKFLAEEMSVQEILDLLNAREKLITITEGAWEKGVNPIVDFYVWNGPEPAKFDSALTFVRGDKIQPEQKKLEEARGLYVSDYQKVIEEKWLKELHSKYKVTVNKKLLKTIKGV
ncbi:MAG TPA: hypothetical protein DER09_03600 [Prolixibacteraceae bacterium]|nr:hypothetical protein [Prolixibacteraceae bacterium]